MRKIDKKGINTSIINKIIIECKRKYINMYSDISRIKKKIIPDTKSLLRDFLKVHSSCFKSKINVSPDKL
jgi:hypothetical protein